MSLNPNCSDLSNGVIRVDQHEKRAVSLQCVSSMRCYEDHNVWERTE